MKAKKTKAPLRRTELDRIVVKLRPILHRQTTDVILAGQLLLESRELLADEHGQWMPWLAENFDLSYRTAVNYMSAAKYAARQNCNVVSHLRNVAPTVLYGLAQGDYTEQEEAEILAQAKAGMRIDQDRAWEIRKALAPPDDDDADDDDDQDHDGKDGGRDGAEEDAEIGAILEGPPPAVPPPAPNLAPPDFALRDFEQAIGALKRLRTKPPRQFASTMHSAEDLEGVECFIRAVARSRAGR
jgi:hypothetical protein